MREYSSILPTKNYTYSNNEDGNSNLSYSSSRFEPNFSYFNESSQLNNVCFSICSLWTRFYQSILLFVSSISSTLRSLIEILWYKPVDGISTKGQPGSTTVATHCDSSIIFAFITVVLCCSGERVFYKQSVDQLLNPLQFVLIQLMLLGSCLVFTIVTVHKLAVGEIS